MHYTSNVEVKPVIRQENEIKPSLRQEDTGGKVQQEESPAEAALQKEMSGTEKAAEHPALSRIALLRRKMKKNGVYAYLIPSSDFFGSEYVNDHFKVREFFSGFTGSAGELLVTADEALLWTDGRYFIQAERELEGSGIRLMRSGEEGVDTIEEYLKKNLSEDSVLGFDGRTVCAAKALKLKKAVPSGKIIYKKDLSEGIFERPELTGGRIRTLNEALSGEASSDRIEKLRKELEKNGCDAVFLSRPEDIAWLFNIRGDDIEHTPVALAYAFITKERSFLFIKNGGLIAGLTNAVIRSCDEIYAFLKKENRVRRVMADRDNVNYRCFRLLKKNSRVVSGGDLIASMRAVKNETELSHIKDIYHKDSLALTRFLKWISECREELTETEAAEKLLSFRKEIPEFNDISFTTIAAYGENAAMIHYEPSEDRPVKIGKRGFLMVDSGGQYEGGTTDVTRTVVMGELTGEEREAFTLTALGMLKLMNARFLKGTTGQNLDILARERLWQKGIDYKHGTGHGVGYMLSVHEGPQSISTGGGRKAFALKPGMLVSDEPGVYREGRFGVRTENILLVEEDMETEDGKFLRFRNLTEVPIDDRGIDRRLMTQEELRMYTDFQKGVCEALSGELSEAEKVWLYRYAGVTRY